MSKFSEKFRLVNGRKGLFTSGFIFFCFLLFVLIIVDWRMDKKIACERKLLPDSKIMWSQKRGLWTICRIRGTDTLYLRKDMSKPTFRQGWGNWIAMYSDSCQAKEDYFQALNNDGDLSDFKIY